MRFSKVKKRIGYAFFLIFFTLIAAEIILRIYNPFATSVAGDRVTIHTNTIVQINNGPNSLGLDESFTVSKNSLGFRGPEPPENFGDHLTIITVGGSTTECMLIPEDKTWTSLLGQQLQSSFPNTWANNAGLSGHSTYGHIKLMEEYIAKLHPDYCLFLVGCNDVDRSDLVPKEKNINSENQKFILKLAKYSVLANVSLNFYRHHLATRRQLVNNKHFTFLGKEKIELSDSTIKLKLREQTDLLTQYGQRLQRLIDVCAQSNITPIFVTQPCSLGEGIDAKTGVDLATFPTHEGNGKLTWVMLQLYNQKTMEVCKENGVSVIDLANQIPKGLQCFYDTYHFNNAGCKLVSEIIYDSILAIIANKESKHLVK